ncbi:putative Clp ATPase [Helianthus annuus]|nr:putative Clp ATPase [Helianthus annuus]
MNLHKKRMENNRLATPEHRFYKKKKKKPIFALLTTMTHSKNTHLTRFPTREVKLHFTEKALRLIGQKAMVKNTGARGLRAILETLLLTDAMYEIPDVKMGNDRVEAMVIDEESVGSVDKPGCGGKILRGDGALDDYLAKTKCKEQEVRTLTFRLNKSTINSILI